MPTLPRFLTRSVFARTNADLLVNDPDGFPSDYPPVWWYGLDSGGGAYPIGPNGPHGDFAAIPAVIRATSLIVGPLTAAPFKVLEQQHSGEPRPPARWLTDPMLVRPDDRFGAGEHAAAAQLPRSEFWAEWLRSAIWTGLGAFVCREDNLGQPLAGSLRMVHPGTLSTERDSVGALCWVLGGYEGESIRFDRSGRAGVWRLVVLRNPHSPVDSEGMSKGVFALSPSAFQLNQQVESYAAGQFRSGIPNGYLKVNAPQLTQPKASELKGAWMNAHGGDRRSIAVLNATTDFVPVSLSPVDAALAEVKRLNIGDVAFAFGLDPYTLGASIGNSATYTNIRDAWTNHKDFGLAPWIAAVEDTLTALIPGPVGVKVNLDAFANPPAKERIDAGAAAVAAGLITVNEWRANEGLPPLDDPVSPDSPPGPQEPPPGAQEPPEEGTPQ